MHHGSSASVIARVSFELGIEGWYSFAYMFVVCMYVYMCICGVYVCVQVCMHVEGIDSWAAFSLIMLYLIFGGRASHLCLVPFNSIILVNHLVSGGVPVSADRVLGSQMSRHMHTSTQILGLLLLVWLSPLPSQSGSPGPSLPEQRRSGQSWAKHTQHCLGQRGQNESSVTFTAGHKGAVYSYRTEVAFPLGFIAILPISVFPPLSHKPESWSTL